MLRAIHPQATITRGNVQIVTIQIRFLGQRSATVSQPGTGVQTTIVHRVILVATRLAGHAPIVIRKTKWMISIRKKVGITVVTVPNVTQTAVNMIS